MRDSLIALAIESWRLSRTFKSLLEKSDITEQRRYSGKILWFNKRLEETLTACELQLVELEDHKFDTGMAAKAINLQDFENHENLIVDQTLEPVIMGAEGVIKRGTVTLRKKENE